MNPPKPATKRKRKAPAKKKAPARVAKREENPLATLAEESVRYIQREPLKALAGAAVAGLLIRRIPLLALAGGVVRLLFVAAKPALVAYASQHASGLLAPPRGRQR